MLISSGLKLAFQLHHETKVATFGHQTWPSDLADILHQGKVERFINAKDL